MDTPSTIFAPTPDLADRILAAIADPRQSLAHIAEQAKTTLEALTLWMTSPGPDGGRDRLTATESAFAWRTRLCATTILPQALDALTKVLDHPLFPGNTTNRSSSAECLTPSAELQRPSALLTHRVIETVRKAATTILRLTHFRPLPYNARAADEPRAARSESQSPAPPMVPVPQVAGISPRSSYLPSAPDNPPLPVQTKPGDLCRAHQVATISPPPRPVFNPAPPPRFARPAATFPLKANRGTRASLILQAAGSAASPRAP